MSRQDKATTERHARILRELVKRQENKVCADCKRNDPRWASWNIGVFLCIRCSGIHRGMGTHISRVKSIDLDTWTPEQMQSIEKWGNRRANLYWEAHLKSGHIPPDHKMESYIRSKYESRRWALDGPPPSDPSALEAGGDPSPSLESGDAPHSARSSTPLEQFVSVAPSSALSSRLAPTHIRAPGSISAPRVASPSLTAPTYMRNQPQPRQLLSAAVAGRTGQGQGQSQLQPQAQLQSQSQAPTTTNDDLFSLDFHAPAPLKMASSPPPTVKDVKQDILSLFSATPSSTSVPATVTTGSSVGAQPTNVPQATSMMGQSGIGAWGVSSGWTPVHSNGSWGGTSASGTPSVFGSGAYTAATPAAGGTFNAANIWASSFDSTASVIPNVGSTDTNSGDIFGSGNGGNFLNSGQSLLSQSKKDDVFGDLWGDFK
ncbi:hypothetical protein BKA82DRAFT_1002829 [Pisolithus tinctorius]|uniref:Arf-GAP domain-containing protein n=1 Tax=Pisolithus tinctorius Marx 270 TaxID=870435 RepID=A0A0C3P2H1_PISTI|nr:hypothetical protein BKA82DRAFT_1002829 [Pisolithus tinctorius]KIO01691.1 hypothetical protein M404DRAFT_1002829 [Pisolithus tinctorius Marx 270]